MSRTVDVEIDSIAAGGDGVARAGGLVVFIPRSAPGDAGRARIEKTGRFARARWEVIRRPGPSRIEPPCGHYVADRCGGCQLQHVTYDAQLEAKSDIIRDALQRIGKREVARPLVRPSPQQWRYRRKLTLALRRQTVGERWIAGLHPYDAPGRVFDLRDCPITDERVLEVWREIRAAAHLLPRELELRGAVRLAADGDARAASFLLEGGTHWPAHNEFFDSVRSLDSLWWAPEGQGRRRLGARGAVDPSFVQVNAAVASELHAHVVSVAFSHSPRTVVDAYAGSGDTAAPLAQAGAHVTAIELDRDGAARGAARLPAPSRMIQARVEDALPDLLPADVMLLNPPRLGLHERVPELLSRAGSVAKAIIYVSCNPATLARDLARLPGYRVASLLGFDMFPQTAHVETVCELVPIGA